MYSFILIIVFVVLGFVIKIKRMANDAKREFKVDAYKKRLLVISHD